MGGGGCFSSFPVEDSACGDGQKASGEAAADPGGLLAEAAQEESGEEGGRDGGGRGEWGCRPGILQRAEAPTLQLGRRRGMPAVSRRYVL